MYFNRFQRELLCFRGWASSGKRTCFMLSSCTHCGAPSQGHARWVLNTQEVDQKNDKLFIVKSLKKEKFTKKIDGRF